MTRIKIDQATRRPRSIAGTVGILLQRSLVALIAVYLIPVMLIVLTIGAAGILCCAASRLARGGQIMETAHPGGRRLHGAHRGTGAPNHPVVHRRSSIR